MPRIHAPEIEDEAWCPTVLRDGLTTFLQVSAEKLALYDPATPTVAALLKAHDAERVVDLCSGGGGPVLRLCQRLQSEHGLLVGATLTDLYPNVDAFARAEARSAGTVVGHRTPTDASDVPDGLVGVRTIFNGFHHFRPDLARRIVEDAARKGQPFVSVEIVERRFLTVATIMGVPLLALLLTPFSSPTVARLALTYLVPIIPAAILWDGMMSCLRGYSVDELVALTDDLNSDTYRFRVEQVPSRLLPMRITMLIGEPIAAAPRS